MSFASATANIPIGSGIYHDLERLQIKGLINKGLLSSKPFSRKEGARLVQEAIEASERLAAHDEQIEGILKRLKREFGEELLERDGTTISVKLAETVYLKYLYDSKARFYPGINNHGDILQEGSNLRAGFASEVRLVDMLAMYLNPEYQLDEDHSKGELLYGYAILLLANLEIELGRDSMWWGSGGHGGLIMTNHAKPFDLLKLTSQRPFLLPWIFSYLGIFKPTLFLTELEADRDFPHANLMGLRLDFEPTSRFQIGLSRVVMFGGEGRPSLSGSDWIKILTVSDSAEHGNSSINGNQIVSIDASYIYSNKIRVLPVSGLKAYIEWGAEDSSGNGTPTGRAYLFGLLIDEPFWIKEGDFRVEWADTAGSARYGPKWYQHGVYTTGYRYEGNIMGHHMGSDARDLFVRFQYHFDGGALVAAEADGERSGIHSATLTTTRWAGLDFSYPINQDLTLQAGYGYEHLEDPVNSRIEGGSVVWGKISWD